MRFHFEGKYDGNPEHLKNQRMVQGAVKFREPSYKVFAFIANIASLAVLIAVVSLAIWRGGRDSFSYAGFILAILSLVPHEFLHMLCFTGDVYMYTNLSKGMLFVVGSESMSKQRYIFMSLLPNIVFGFIPYLIYMIHPAFKLLGTMGSFAITFGTGDYINVFNAVTQMPKNALTYLHQMDSYWYIPEQ